MHRVQQIYKSLPVSAQNITCSIEGWRIKRQRFGGNFQDLLEKAEMRSHWSEDQIIAYRNNRLSLFLEYCQKNIPFYRDYFTKNGLDYRDINTIEDLRGLPIITKQVINNNSTAFTSVNIPKRELIKMHTSGSTGSPLHFYTTKSAIRELWAIHWRYRRWHGIDLDMWGAYLTGRPIVPIKNNKPPFWRINIPGKQLLLSGLHLNRNNSIYYLHELKKRQIKWIYGYPSLIALLSGYMLEMNYDIGYKIKWITVNSENLLTEQATLISEAFGVKPIQLYGTAEAVAHISECPSGSLHVDEDDSAVEFIKLNDIDGYIIVGTNFSNYATAFLRYEINDVFQLSNGRCPCGRPGRIVISIDGRKDDYILVQEGNNITRISPTLLYRPFTNSSNIIEGQIIQKSIDTIIVNIVKNELYTNDDEQIFLQNLKERTRGLINIKLEYMDRIPRGSNGKLRLVISELHE
jgi:phenylacetate-CoA ligase